MSNNKCSFCAAEDDVRKYLVSDDGIATVCSNCALMFAQYMLDQKENDSINSQENQALNKEHINKNDAFYNYLVQLEEKWMEKNVVNSYILQCGGVINEVNFRFEDEGDEYYFVCELEVEGIDSVPADVEEKILNEIEWAFDEIRDDLEEQGLDLESSLGEKLLLTKVDDDSGKSLSINKFQDDEKNFNLSHISANYQYLKQINFGSIIKDNEDLIECMNTPSILILSSHIYATNLVIIGDDKQIVFEDIYEAYNYCAKFIAELKITDLTQKKILGLITSASDEDGDGMYETLQAEGGEVLLSHSIDIQNLREEAEDSLNNTDLFDMPFCLVQYTDSANINLNGGSLSVNGSDIELSEITELPGYMDCMENKVCIYVT